MDLPAPVATLASAQFSVVSRAQLLDGGVNLSAVRWGVGTAWTVLLPGVVMLHTGPPSYQQRLVAALLYAGSGSWLAGHTAAALIGRGGCGGDPDGDPPRSRARDAADRACLRTCLRPPSPARDSGTQGLGSGVIGSSWRGRGDQIKAVG